MDAQLHAKLASLGYRGAPEMLRPGLVNINTYVHVITKDNGTGAPTPQPTRSDIGSVSCTRSKVGAMGPEEPLLAG